MYLCSEFWFRSWTHSDADFDLKILDESGQETDIYLLNEYIVATMDYYIACCIFASIPQCRDLYIVFEEQAPTEDATGARSS